MRWLAQVPLSVGLGVMGAIVGTILEQDGLPPYDVRNDTPERRAALRQGTKAILAGTIIATAPADAADHVAMAERLHTAMQGVTCPDDPCGWYRYGWLTHNALMDSILDNEGLATALALAVDDKDAPALMRLAGIAPSSVECKRFWFGFRDANAEMASQIGAAFSS